MTSSPDSKATLLIALIATVCFGCAGRDAVGGPIVDMKGVNPASYQRDLSECQQYATQVGVGDKAMVGAAAGAVVGGLVGAAAGDSDTAKRSAGGGAVLGGASGVAKGLGEKDAVVKNCLRNRGYAVLN
jgi:outer membrane lipoprotein SlyB